METIFKTISIQCFYLRKKGTFFKSGLFLLNILFFLTSCSNKESASNDHHPFKIASSDLLPLAEYVQLDRNKFNNNKIRLSINHEYRTNLQNWIDTLSPKLKKRSVLKEIIQNEVINKHYIDSISDSKLKEKSIITLKILNDLEQSFFSVDNSIKTNMQSIENYTIINAYYMIRTAFNSRGYQTPVVPLSMLLSMRNQQTRYMRYGKILNQKLNLYIKHATNLLDLLHIKYQYQLTDVDILFMKLKQINHKSNCYNYCTNSSNLHQFKKLIYLTDGREYLFNNFYFSNIGITGKSRHNSNDISKMISFMSEDIIGFLNKDRNKILSEALKSKKLKYTLKKHMAHFYIEGRGISSFYREKIIADKKYDLVFKDNHPLKVLSPNDTINFRTWINEVSDDHTIFVNDWVSIIKNQQLLFNKSAGNLQFAVGQYFDILEKIVKSPNVIDSDITLLNTKFAEIDSLLYEVKKRLRVYNSYMYEMIGMSTKEFIFLI